MKTTRRGILKAIGGLFAAGAAVKVAAQPEELEPEFENTEDTFEAGGLESGHLFGIDPGATFKGGYTYRMKDEPPTLFLSPKVYQDLQDDLDQLGVYDATHLTRENFDKARETMKLHTMAGPVEIVEDPYAREPFLLNLPPEMDHYRDHIEEHVKALSGATSATKKRRK